MAPRFSSRNVPDTPLNTGMRRSSSAWNVYPPSDAAMEVPATPLLVSAPVGHETIHSPQEMHVELPMGAFKSKAMPVEYPLPMRPRTKLFLISSQPRIQRSQRMHASWSTAMASEDSSRPRATLRFANRGSVIPAACACVSSSQSPECCWRAQGVGWSDIRSSRTVLRAAKTFSELVETFMPGSHGRTHAAEST